MLCRCFYLAPCSRSNFTTSSSPYVAACCNAVSPSLSFASTSAPCSSSSRTASSTTFTDAPCNAVWPCSPPAFTSPPPPPHTPFPSPPLHLPSYPTTDTPPL